jgi:predicted enzyme related to lactoylglutathione lyase
MPNSKVLEWFELPTADLARAIGFYNTVLSINMQGIDFGPSRIAVFPREEGDPSGCLIHADDHTPSQAGTVIYINAGRDLEPALQRIEPAGGKVLVSKTQVGPGMGYYAVFVDSEGNRVGLASPE